MADAAFFDDLAAYGEGEEKGGDVYDRFADKYDDIMSRTNYATVQNYVATLFKNNVTNLDSAKILDIGCGTGTSGIHLKNVGFKNIDGSDASAKSVEVAAEKKLYSRLFQGMITSKDQLDCGDKEYDGVCCLGAITKGHIEVRPALDEFCRVVKAGGYVACTISASDGFMEVLSEFMSAKKIQLELLERKFFYKEFDQEFYCHCCLIKIL